MPFGLRGGLPLYGSAIARPALLLATADGHPRAISYTSWVPKATTRRSAGIRSTSALVAVQDGHRCPRPGSPRRGATCGACDIGWVLVWRAERPRRVIQYLTATGFVFDYRADGVSVYRPAWK